MASPRLQAILDAHPDPDKCPRFATVEDMPSTGQQGRFYDDVILYAALGHGAASIRRRLRTGKSIRDIQGILDHPIVAEEVRLRREEMESLRIGYELKLMDAMDSAFEQMVKKVKSGKATFDQAHKLASFCADRDPGGHFAKTNKVQKTVLNVFDTSAIEELKANYSQLRDERAQAIDVNAEVDDDEDVDHAA